MTWCPPPVAALRDLVSPKHESCTSGVPADAGTQRPQVCRIERSDTSVVPANAGTQRLCAALPPIQQRHWVPAFAGTTFEAIAAGRYGPYPNIGMWNPGAALPSSGQRVVSVLPRV